MKKIQNIIVHCSDSVHGCAREIRNWHKQRGWRDIGYHFVILNGRVISSFDIPSMDGSIECGRYINEDIYVNSSEAGAHALGYNAESVGICLIGKNQFTARQTSSMLHLLMDLIFQYRLSPKAVIGHYETESGRAQGKTCPNMDMDLVRKTLKVKLFSETCEEET